MKYQIMSYPNLVTREIGPEVPDGYQSPVHAIYIQDNKSLMNVGTCFESDAIFVMEPELD